MCASVGTPVAWQPSAAGVAGFAADLADRIDDAYRAGGLRRCARPGDLAARAARARALLRGPR